MVGVTWDHTKLGSPLSAGAAPRQRLGSAVLTMPGLWRGVCSGQTASRQVLVSLVNLSVSRDPYSRSLVITCEKNRQ